MNKTMNTILKIFLVINKGSVQAVAVPGKAETKLIHSPSLSSMYSIISSNANTAFLSTKLAVVHPILAASLNCSVKQWQQKREEPHQLDICVIHGEQSCTDRTLPNVICMFSVLTEITGSLAGSGLAPFPPPPDVPVVNPSRFTKSVKHFANKRNMIRLHNKAVPKRRFLIN